MVAYRRCEMDDYKIEAKCDVCGNNIVVDRYGNGDECSICGWRQSEEAFNHPNIAGIRNIPSLNNAIKQFKEGKSATLANFQDFINALEHYGELEFTYNNTRFGVLFNDASNKIILLNINNNQKQYYSDINNFADNANIDGLYLKDIWQNVTNTDFLQETE